MTACWGFSLTVVDTPMRWANSAYNKTDVTWADVTWADVLQLSGGTKNAKSPLSGFIFPCGNNCSSIPNGSKAVSSPNGYFFRVIVISSLSSH